MTDEILQKLGITRKIKGVLVNNIEEDSPALGIIAKGDIIMEVNRKPVTNTKEYNDTVSTIEKGKDILLTIVRGGFPQVITIPAR